MNGILDATCMHGWHRSISKLCNRIHFLRPQVLCVFGIDWVDGTEVLLKLILGLKNHPYNSSIQLTETLKPLHYFVSVISFRTYKHCSVCHCSVAGVYKGGAGHTSSGLLATDETATSFARFGKCWTNSIPCYAPYGPGRHLMY